jgi:anti-sigma regulatory factor (Ser/Thr protein kinase)
MKGYLMTGRLGKPDHSHDTDLPRELLRVLPAQPHSLRPARVALAEWLTLLQWPDDDADDLILAVSEAVTNVIEHAYPATRPGLVGLHARCGAGSTPATRRVTIAITDRGDWAREYRAIDPASYHSYGLTVMSACTAEMQIQRSASGTTVILTSNDAPIPRHVSGRA